MFKILKLSKIFFLQNFATFNITLNVLITTQNKLEKNLQILK